MKNLFNPDIPKPQPNKDTSFDDDLAIIPEVLQDVECLPYDDVRIQQANIEGNLDEYEGTYDDYLELFIQFGYVVSIEFESLLFTSLT